MTGLFRAVWRLLNPFHAWVAQAIGTILLFQSLELIPPFFFRAIIDQIDRSATAGERLVLGSCTMGPVSPFQMGLIFLCAWYLMNMGNSLVDRLVHLRVTQLLGRFRRSVFRLSHRKLLSLDLGYHEREQTGKKVGSVLRGVEKITELVDYVAYEIVPTGIQVLLAFGVLFWQDLRLGGMLLLFVAVFLFLLHRRQQKTRPFRLKRHDAYEAADSLMTQAVVNIRTVQTCGQEEYEERRHHRKWRLATKLSEMELAIMHRMGFSQSTVINTARMSVFLFGLLLIERQEITLGTLLLFLNFSERALYSLWRFKRLAEHIDDAGEAVGRLQALLDEPAAIVESPDAIAPPRVRGLLTFDDVRFFYPNGGAAIDRISFNVSAGETIALVGPSGGGKSTIVKLLLRHIDPQSGHILLDGIPLPQFQLRCLRRSFGVVHQNVEIFNGTIRSNVAYAFLRATDDQVWEALETAQLATFVSELPDGLETMVGERGVTLSGGQCQRLGIARAILGNPPILIFDEATSHLDSQSERLIQDALETIAVNRTTIIIAHRLSTIQKADRIFVIDRGRKIEEGTHDQLMRCENGMYRALQELQFSGELRV